MNLQDKIELLPLLLPALIASMVLHELAHAYVAKWLGDITAQQMGRLTLNPIKHLEPMGSIMFVVTFLFFPFTFGWARPVPVLTKQFRNPKVGMAIVAIAGPITNFLLAVVTVFAIAHTDLHLSEYFGNLVFEFVYINIVLGVFNLIPVPPLDGSRILGAFLTDNLHMKWSALDQYGMLFLLFLFTIGNDLTTSIMDFGVGHSYDVLNWIAGA
jgi:Zn-dependent protease